MQTIETTALKVFVLSRPSFDLVEFAAFLAENGMNWREDPVATEGERLVEVAGRVCYLSFTAEEGRTRYPNAAYVSNLIKRGHESVLEHASWTFILDGVSRAFTHQLVRHRVGFSFSQLSQQYHDESDARFVVPHGLIEGTPAYALWEGAMQEIRERYRSLLNAALGAGPMDRKEFSRWMRSVARSLLPNSTATTIAVSANARALRHFLKLRGAIEGDYEMRAVSVALLRKVSSDAPALFADFRVRLHSDGSELVEQCPLE